LALADESACRLRAERFGFSLRGITRFLVLFCFRRQLSVIPARYYKLCIRPNLLDGTHIKSVIRYLRTLTTWHCPHARTPLLQHSIDISRPPGPQQQTCNSGSAAVEPCWDRQTDGRTLDKRLTSTMTFTGWTDVPRGVIFTNCA